MTEYGFDSILVRLKGIKGGKHHEKVLFRFHTGSIKRTFGVPPSLTQSCFDSILVRLKGFAKAMDILYAILMVRVKSILATGIFKVALLSTCSRANLLGG